MAAKVNTKLVLVILGVLLVAGAGVGYLGLLAYRGDTQRNIAAGDALMAEGAYRDAKGMYGRAVRKAPGDAAFAAKYRDALTSITPRTEEEAIQLYEELLKINRQLASARQTDPEAHLINIRELEFRARILRTGAAWEQVVDAADDMAINVPTVESDYVESLYYRGLGRMQQIASLQFEDILQAESDLRAFLEARPDDDDGWAALLAGKIASFELARRQGLIRETRELGDEITTLFTEAPDGFGVANLRAAWLQARRLDMPEDIDADAPVQAALRGLDYAVDSEDPMDLLAIAETIVRLAPEEGLPPLIDALQRHVDDAPDALMHAVTLARLNYFEGELDAALAVVDEIVESDPLRVGLMSAFQSQARKLAVALAADVHFRRWQLAETDAAKQEHFTALRAARDLVAQYATDESADVQLMKADAKVALASGDEDQAVIRLERYIDNAASLSNDVDMLIYAGQALESTGRPGMALRRYTTAVELRPRSALLWLQKARLETDMNRLEEAKRSLDVAAEIDPENEVLRDARDRLRIVRGEIEGGPAAGETVGDVLVDARAMKQRGEVDAARSLVAAELAREPNRVPLLLVAAEIEFAAGDQDAALELIRRAKVEQPENPQLLMIEEALTSQNPIEMFRTFLNATEDNDQRRAVALAVGLAEFEAREAERLARLEAAGDAGLADAVRDQLAEIRTAAADAMVEAKAVAPDHVILLDYELGQAIRAEDWAAGEAIVDRAAATDADGARGLLFRGRLLLAQSEARSDPGLTQAAVQALEEAVQTLHFSAAAWRLLADANQRLGRLDAAEAAFSEAYQCNPNDAATVRAYAALLDRLGEPARALPILSRAARRLRSDVDLREQWLDLEAREGLISTVLKERRTIYDRRDPETYADSVGGRRNAMALARTLGSAEPGYENVVDAKGQPRYDAARWNRLSSTVQARELGEVRSAWRQEAEAILADLRARIAPEHQFTLALLEADILRQRGEFDAGETVLRTYLEEKAGPDDQGDVLLAIGRFQADAGKLAEAVKSFEAARPHQGDDMAADLELARVYAAAREFDRAAIHYDRVLETVVDPEIGAQRVECAVMLERYDEATQLLENEVARHGDSVVFAMLEAAIHGGRADEAWAADDLDEATRRREAQQAALDRAAALAPRDPMPYVQEAQARLAMYEHRKDEFLLDDAMDALNEAARLNKSFIPGRLTRADVHLARGDLTAATAELEQVLRDAPYSDELRRRLVTMLITENRLTAATELIEDAVDLYPKDPVWLETLGELYVRQGDRRAALDAFARAFALEPLRSTLIKRAVLLLEQDPPRFDDVIALIESRPDDLEKDPMVRAIYARAMYGVGLRDQALDQMKRSYDGFRAAIRSGQQEQQVIRDWFRVVRPMFPRERPVELERFVLDLSNRRPDVYELEQLASVWVASSRAGLSRATELQREAIAAAPAGDADLRAELYGTLGVFLITEGDAEGAASAFEEVVRLRPDDPDANNNYAYVLADRLNRPADALPFAERAVALSPGNANLLDTLGMIHLRLGRLDEAEEALRASINSQPLAAAHVHLAELLIARGDRDAARTYLQRAEELRPNSRTREEIRRLSAELTR